MDLSGKIIKIAGKARWRLRVLSAPRRVLPDFLIIGAAKCGTTSLYDYLVQHPNILPQYDNRKEINYFDRKLKKGLNWYKGHFPLQSEMRQAQARVGGPVLAGEATTSYLFHPHAPRFARELMPGAKIIALLRNPVERAYSQYHHEFRKGRENLPFEEAIAMEPRRLQGEYEKILEDKFYYSSKRHDHSYLQRGRYCEQLARWLQFFPREQLLILKSEDLFQDPALLYEKVLDFLGLPPCDNVRFEKMNPGAYTELNPELRNRLESYFRPENEKLYKLLDVNLGWDKG